MLAMSPLAIFTDLASSLSMDESGLLRSTWDDDAERIELANDILRDEPTLNPDSRLWLLQDLIYTRIYQKPAETHKNSEDTEHYKNSRSGGVKSNFFQRLHQHNQGQGYADPGWEIMAFDPDGSIQVHKDGLTLWVTPQKHLFESPCDKTVGEWIAIRLPKNILDPGVYVAVGNAGPIRPRLSPEAVIQIHFNFEWFHAPQILAHWTSALNEAMIPFCFAVGHEMEHYERADPGLLLLHQKHRAYLLETLRRFLVDHASLLRDEVPVWTKIIAPGVGYAEVPDNPEIQHSFHLHRCQLMAEGLLTAWEQGTDAIASMAQRFQEYGIDLDKPFLNPGATDFEF